MEAAGLGIFMISASAFAVLLEHPASPARQFIDDAFLRRVVMGMAMGLTLIGIVYSPWGKQSGAHLNPAFTLTFFRLGKVAPWDAVFYIVAQFIGGIAGIFLMLPILKSGLAHPAVNYVATVPGPNGAWIAFLAEVIISFILVFVVLSVSNSNKLQRFTGLFAAACLASFIAFEAPLSGVSLNPARTLGSAVVPQLWKTLWIYFLAPPLGMLIAAEIYPRIKGRIACAKLHHQNKKRCIFCEYHTNQINKSAAGML